MRKKIVTNRSDVRAPRSTSPFPGRPDAEQVGHTGVCGRDDSAIELGEPPSLVRPHRIAAVNVREPSSHRSSVSRRDRSMHRSSRGFEFEISLRSA